MWANTKIMVGPADWHYYFFISFGFWSKRLVWLSRSEGSRYTEVITTRCRKVWHIGWHWAGIDLGMLMEAVITFIRNTGKTSVSVMVRAQCCHHIGLKEKLKR